MEMIERVAKALYEARNGPGCYPWGNRLKAHKDEYRSDARAAIEALRDPTGREMATGPVAYTKVAGECRPVAFRAGWNAVIDAALAIRATPVSEREEPQDAL